MYSYKKQPSTYQIAEMKEETNETSFSQNGSAVSGLFTSKMLKSASENRYNGMEQTQGVNQYQYLMRQPTSQSIYSPMFKSGTNINGILSSNDIQQDMVVSKYYSKQSSLQKNQLSLQKNHSDNRYMNSSIQFIQSNSLKANLNTIQKQIQYKMVEPFTIDNQDLQQQRILSPTSSQPPYKSSFSLESNLQPPSQYQKQIYDLKNRNSQLEIMIANFKVDQIKFKSLEMQCRDQQEHIRELQWKLERQKNQPLPTLKRVLDTEQDYEQELSIITEKQENKQLKERISSLEYDLKLVYSQQHTQKWRNPEKVEIENNTLIKLVEELQKQNQDLSDKLMFAQPYKDKYNSLLLENQLRSKLSDNEKSDKLFGCFC